MISANYMIKLAGAAFLSAWTAWIPASYADHCDPAAQLEVAECIHEPKKPDIHFQAAVGAWSHYMSNGARVTDKPVFQATAGVSYKDTFRLIGFWNFDTQAGEFSENDFSASIKHTLSEDYKAAVFGGITNYNFPGGPIRSVNQVFGGFTLEKLVNLTSTYYSLLGFPGYQVLNELSYTYKFNIQQVEINLTGTLGHRIRSHGPDGIEFLETRATIPIMKKPLTALLVGYAKTLGNLKDQPDTLYTALIFSF